MLLGTLRASLLGNLLTGKGSIRKSGSEEMKLMSQGQEISRARKGKGKGVLRAGEGVLRTGYGRPSSSASHNKMDF